MMAVSNKNNCFSDISSVSLRYPPQTIGNIQLSFNSHSNVKFNEK